MRRRFLRAALRLVPRAWRGTVARDLEEEAAAGRRGTAWLSWQAVRTGVPLRRASVGDFVATSVRQTVRSLARSRGFALAAVSSFALGIGANVALLSVMDRLVFRPLPFPERDRLVVVFSGTPEDSPRLWHAQALALQEQATTLDGLATAYGSDGEGLIVEELGESPVRFGVASPNLLRLLGIRPIEGRDFAADPVDDAAPSDVPREVLITDAFWRRQFNRSPDALDRIFISQQRRYHIVGVLPPDFVNPSVELSGRIDGLMASDGRVEGPPRDRTTVGARLARLAPGRTVAEAQAEMAAIGARVAAEHPDFMGIQAPMTAEPLRVGMLRPYARFLWLILGAAGLVLLIACANLSTLFLARGRAKVHETAIRSTLGASRWRLVGAAIAEALVVCFAGAGAALVTLASVQTLHVSVVPPEFRGFEVSAFDVRLIALTFGLAAASALLAALVPALASTRFDPLSALRQGRPTGGTRRLTTGRSILALEAAIAVVLVAAAGGAVRSFGGLVFRDPGFVAADLYRTSVFFEPARNLLNMERARALATIEQALSDVPDVDGWTAVTYPPIARGRLSHPYWSMLDIEGGVIGVTDTTLEVLRTPLLAGRGISADDIRSAAPVALINRRAAAALWPGEPFEEAIGRSLTMPYGGVRDVVGVVTDIRSRPGVSAWPMLYVPIGDGVAAKPGWAMELPVLLRMRPGTTPDRRELLARFQALVPTGMAGAPVAVTDELAPWLEHPRFQAALFGSLALIALVLAAIGLYAITAFDAARRRHETGVRLALGATRGDIRRHVIGGAVRPVLAGSAAGLVAAWWAAQFLQAYLFEVDARDPWTLALVSLVLIATAVVAAWLPARRAARTDPANVLRAT
jgi:predicted permease